jgi:hypothetical protein
LRDEYRAYKLLNASIQSDIRDKKNDIDKDLISGIPKAYFYGTEPLFNYMIIDYLGPSLEDVFDMCGRRFSVKTTCFLALEMVSFIHPSIYPCHDMSLDIPVVFSSLCSIKIVHMSLIGTTNFQIKSAGGI